ncbi:MAG: hypothetical protein IKR85_05960 [Clostridia bacterium]|nr:hypothetical protein [Clostridia bacterium]
MAKSVSRTGARRPARTVSAKSARGGSGIRKTNARRSTAKAAAVRRGAPAKRAPRGAKAQKGGNPNDARGLLLLFLSVVVLILHFSGSPNTVLAWLHDFASGLMGSLSILLPLILIWLSVRAFRASRRGEEDAMWAFLPIVIGFSVFTAVQGFHVDNIVAGLGIKKSYANFLTHAYDAQAGGGLIGSLAAYPLTRLITRWGTLIVCLALGAFALHKSGLISLNTIGGFIGKNGHSLGVRMKELTGNLEKKVSGKVKELSAERRRSREELFDDEIYHGSVKAPVKPHDLSKDKSKSKVTKLAGIGDVFDVPEITRAPSSRKKTVSFDVEGDYTPYTPKSDITREIEREDPSARNDRFIKSALSDHSRKPKPKLTFNYTPESPASEAAAEPESKRAAAPEASAPLPRQPQKPKPSFFEEEVTPAVRQNTEQGKPSETTYVKPVIEKKPEPKPAVNSEPERAPVKKTEPARAYNYPPMDLMEAGDGTHSSYSTEAVDRERAEVLVRTLQSFSIPVKLTGVSHGPAVTRFEILPAAGIKVSRISSYADDIAMALSAVSVRIEAPIPGKNAVGVEVPNKSTEIVRLRDVLECSEARKSSKRLLVGLGKDNSGKYIVADLASMPHVLIAGQTGSGKSVCINAIIISILYRATPDQVKMILIDPKMVELNAYSTIPHLLVPVVTDPKKAAGALEWAVSEMTRRYKLFAEKGAKNIESYNSHLEPDEEKMPQIVIIIDELADLMMTSPRDVEDAINRLAQLARAAGMHLVIATQRPSVDVVTGLIKANIPTRIAFTVASGVDSRTILDSYGAEKLLGRGDMLYLPSDRNKPIRLQGAWVSGDEVDAVVAHVAGGTSAEFDEDMLNQIENAALSDAEKKDKRDEEAASDTDNLFEEAVRCVVEAGQASISMLQRKLRVGYARAGRLIDEMAQRGYVSNSEGSKSREVLLTREQLNMIFSKDE